MAHPYPNPEPNLKNSWHCYPNTLGEINPQTIPTGVDIKSPLSLISLFIATLF